jgi:3-methyladenine DNA glycosylase AlkC
MNNDLDRLFEENSKPLPSKSPTVNFTNPTSMYSGQTPDMGEQQIKNEKISLGLLSPSFLNGRWNLTESGLTKEEVGDTALSFTIGEGSKGWGERSIQKAYRMVDQFENKGDAMFTTDNRETHHWEQFVEGINFFNIFGENETFRRADEVKKILSTVDPEWTYEKQLSALTEWQESNPEVNDFVAQAGINIQDYVLETRNQQAFIFNINEAVQQARLNIGMQRFEKDNGTLSKLGNSLIEGIKDPLILRDMALTSVATLGLGTVAGLAGVSARALSGSVAAGVNSSRALRGLNLVRQAANTAALATGPMTGLIEGPAYAAIRAVVPSAGRSAVSTLSARGLALALEGGVAGAVSSLADQKADNEWRSLVFADTEKALKYNLGETALAALTGSLGAVGVASAVRFGLGSIGDYKYYKTGDWDGFRRQIANSMDTWATTKDGDIVWGNTLSDGRGIFFGDTVDKFMKSYDGRDFTNVMLNGSRLFGKFNPRIAGKMNLDVKRVMPVIEEFEKATGVAGEAAMLSVDGVDPETRGIFNQLVNESNLADADLTIDDVKAVLVDYNTKQQPQPPTATGRLLTEAPVATQQVEVARQLKRLVAAKSVDRRLEQIGLSSATVLNNAEATLGRSINLSSDADFQNFITAARYEAASVDESQVVNTFKRIVTGDFGGGRVIPKEVVDSIFVAAFGDKPIVVTATGSNKNFAVVVDPKNKDVFATKRTLEKGDDGQLSIKLRADDPKSPFFSKDVLTVDTDTLQAKLVEVNEKLNKAWNDVKTAKIKETIEKVKKTKVKEELVKTFAEGTSVTVDSIKKIFDLTKEEATVAKIIMDSLGYDGDSNLLRIASLVADDRNAEIFFEGNTALIRATKSSDVGTVTHEMSHYLQVMILDELTPDARHAIGITDEIWEKFKDWVGYTGTEWTEKAAEKFANGMSQYVRRVMSGDGRAPKTQVQRLFHRIGDHLGDLGQRFKSQEALEAGMIMSKEAEDVFEALFNRSNSKIGELFDSAYQGLFKRLPKEQRLAIGKEILGEMAFNDYLAKKEIEFEKAKPVVDKLAEAAATKPVTVTSVVNEIYEKVNNATRKVIKEAIASGMSRESVLTFLKDEEAKIGTVTSIDARPANKLTKPTKLTDEELAKFAAIESPFISVVDDVKVKFIDAAFKTEESKLFFSKEDLQDEIKRRAASKVSKTETDIGISSELKADLEELLGPGTFVDSAGMKVELTPTETVVATKVATVVETAKVDKEHATAVIAALEEGRTLDAVEAKRAPIVTPEVINVEETPVSVETELVALAAISTEASATADSLSIPAAKKAEVKTVVAAAVANPSRAKSLLEKYTTTKLEDVAGVSAKAEATTTRQLPSDLVKQFFEAELRAQISRHTIEGIMGLDDKNFSRFLELEKLAEKFEGPLDALVREPTPENLQATANTINWSMEDLKVYVSGALHKRNGSLIAEFVGAKKFVERNIDTIKETRKYIEDKKSAYDAARAVPEANRSKAQEDLIKKYDKAKGTVSQFNNSIERLKIGVLGNTVLEVVPQKISKAKAYLDKGESIQTKWLQLQSLGATVQDLLFKNMIEADPITILKAIEKNIDRLAELVETDGEEVGFPDWRELPKIELWANGYMKSKAASSFVKKIIRNLELNAKRRLEGTKKKVGSEEVVGASGDAVNVLEGSQKVEGVYTDDEKKDFYVKQQAESEALRNLATLFHAHLVDIGKTELAAVFMARREGILQKASDIDNTARLLENYGIQLTVNSVENRISDLRNELTTFVDGLAEDEAKAIRKLLDLEFKPKKQKTLAQRISTEDMEDLSERLMSAGPLDVIRAPDYLIRAAQESSSDLYRRILSGELENGVQVLEELANNPQSKYKTLAGQILNEHRDYLETVGVWVAKLDDNTEGLYTYDNIFLNVKEGTVNVPALIHEVIHAITTKEIDEAGFTQIEGRGHVAYLEALRNSVQSGVDLNGKKLKASVKSIAASYLATVDWIDRTPEALQLLGSDYKEKFVGRADAVEFPTTTHYALINLHEFIANTLTDSDVLAFFAGAKAASGAAKTRPVKEMLNGISRSIFPRATEEQIKNVDKTLQETIVSNLVTGVVKSKVEPVDQMGMVLMPEPTYVPFRLVGTEIQIPEVVRLGDEAELRSALKSAKGRVYAQLNKITEEEAKGGDWTLDGSILENEYGEEFEAFGFEDGTIGALLAHNELAYKGATKYFETPDKVFIKIKTNEKPYSDSVTQALQLILDGSLYDLFPKMDLQQLSYEKYSNSDFAKLPINEQLKTAQYAYTKITTIQNLLPYKHKVFETQSNNAKTLLEAVTQLKSALDLAFPPEPTISKVGDSKYFKKLTELPTIFDEWTVGITHKDLSTSDGYYFKVKDYQKDNAFILSALLTQKPLEWAEDNGEFMLKYTPTISELSTAQQTLLYFLLGEVPSSDKVPIWEPTVSILYDVHLENYFKEFGVDGIKAVLKSEIALDLIPVDIDSQVLIDIKTNLKKLSNYWYDELDKKGVNVEDDLSAVPTDDVQFLLDNYTVAKLEVDSVFPENATIIGPQLGSNPGHQVEINGSKYYLKAAKSKRHANMERAAQLLYRMLGHESLVSEFTDASNLGSEFKTSILTPWVTTTKFDFDNKDHAAKAKLLYIPSAWLANWDVFGQTYDNVSAEGVILDAGGSLVYRARGGEKDFSNTSVKELDSLRDLSKNFTAANIFMELTPEEIKSQIANLEATASNEQIRDVVFSVFDLSDPSEKADADNLVKTLIARKNIIVASLKELGSIESRMPTELRRFIKMPTTAAEEDIFYIREAAKTFENASLEDKQKALEFMHTVLANADMSGELLRSNFYNAYTEFRLKLLGGTQLNRRELISKFFTNDSGRDIAIRDELGMPITFYRGTNRPDVDAQNGDEVSKGSWWGTDLNVARDYGGGRSIMSAYAAVPPERIKVVKLREMTHWSHVKKSDILDPEVVKYLEDRNFNFGGKVDDIAFAYLDLVEDKYDAVRLLDVKDYAKLGSKKIPHDQWVFRPDKQLLKNRNALEFKKTGSQNLLSQKRAVQITRDIIDVAKSVGADTKELEAKLAELVDSAEVRRRNLLAAGLHEEMEPEDLEIINSMIKGTKAFSQPAVDHLTRRTKPSATVAAASRIKFSGKNYRDLTDDERRSFVSDVLLPTVEEKLGNRNRSAGIYSLITDSKVGKGFNSLVGGGAAYGDTADAQSMMLQFFSKIYDPLMDLRDGELSGTFDLFSVDMVNAETNNMYSAAGLLDIQRKITAQVTKTAELEQLYETAWLYLADLESLPSNAVHRELIVELIKGVHKYNTLVSGLLEKYGTLVTPMKPTEYGTIHKVNMLAFEQQDQFVDALVKHALAKERESKDLSIITLDALGWVKLTRDSVSDDIVSVEVKEGSPLGYEPAVYKYSEFKNMAKKASLGKDALTIYEDALVSSRNYVNWDIYRSRGDNYTALRHTMTVAKNRYLNIDSPESRGGKPRTEGVGGGREMDITRILSHNDIAKNPELAKYFDKDIYGLIYQQLRSSVTDAIMTKYITDMFGVKMSFLDLVEVSRKHGEASRGQLAKTEQDSVNRGYDRIKDIWESNTGKLMASRDGLDRHYRSLLESGSRPLVLSASGLRAALTSTGETARAILASNHNRGMLRQVIPNFIQTLKLFSRDKRQTIQQVASATHWLRGLSSDHLLLRAEMNPNNPFGGTIMGSKQGGWFKSWAASWAGAKERNKLEDSIVGKAANYLSIPASRLGAPLAFVNDVTTTLHVQNMQYNLTTNSSKFMALAKALKTSNPESLSDFASLAKKCGLSPKEAIDLSALGLLDPARIQVMIDAAKDQRNYSEGLLDIQRLFLWADGDPIRIDTINRMGALVNATTRHTNTDPTLLDLRINQSPYARSMGVFMQFLLSHSTQEIGRRRRYTTTAYSKHLAGLVMMESIAYSLARPKDDDDDSWIWEDAKEKPIQTVIKVGTSLPLLGSYQYLSALIRMGLLETHSQITGEKSDERYRIPDLYSGPSENVPKKALDMIKDLL